MLSGKRLSSDVVMNIRRIPDKYHLQENDRENVKEEQTSPSSIRLMETLQSHRCAYAALWEYSRKIITCDLYRGYILSHTKLHATITYRRETLLLNGEV